jgi:hypothetical protein
MLAATFFLGGHECESESRHRFSPGGGFFFPGRAAAQAQS